MAEVLFAPVQDEHVYSLRELRDRLDAIASKPTEFETLKHTKNIDRALPRLVAAVTLMESFGYSQISLTSRQLGVGLIIEAGLPTAAIASWARASIFGNRAWAALTSSSVKAATNTSSPSRKAATSSTRHRASAASRC